MENLFFLRVKPLSREWKITKPIKGATLIGSGFEVLKKVEFVGNDLK